jgi:hypothetical protein
MELRAALSAAGGVVVVVAGANAGAWAAAAGAKESPLPWWPAILFCGIAVLGLLLMFAALLRWWPFRGLARSPAEVLDDCIRRGRDVRDQLIYVEIESWDASGVAGEWMLRTANLLHDHYPAILDRFLATAAPMEHEHGDWQPAPPALTVEAKLDVLSKARTALPG